MSHDMMQHPSVAAHACLESVHDFKETIVKGLFEGHDVLVVVIPGADTAFGDEAREEPNHQKPNGLHIEKDRDIKEKVQCKDENGDSVFFVTKRREQSGPPLDGHGRAFFSEGSLDELSYLLLHCGLFSLSCPIH